MKRTTKPIAKCAEALERIADTLDQVLVISNLRLEDAIACTEMVRSSVFINQDVEGPPTVGDGDMLGINAEMTSPREDIPSCPNCSSSNIIHHDGHVDAVLGPKDDPSLEDHCHCMECKHIYPSGEAL